MQVSFLSPNDPWQAVFEGVKGSTPNGFIGKFLKDKIQHLSSQIKNMYFSSGIDDVTISRGM